MMPTQTTVACALCVAVGAVYVADARSQETSTESITIKMVLKNQQVKAVRQAQGNIVPIKLTSAQKKLIRGRAPKFKGNIIRLSTDHLRKGSNKIDLLIIKTSSSAPILRVVPPHDKHQKSEPG